MFSWLDAKAAEEFGRRLAEQFIEKDKRHGEKDEKRFQQKSAKALQAMGAAVDEFKKSHRCNFYQKAKLGNAFRWSLKSAGYETAQIEELLRWLMLRIGAERGGD